MTDNEILTPAGIIQAYCALDTKNLDRAKELKTNIIKALTAMGEGDPNLGIIRLDNQLEDEDPGHARPTTFDITIFRTKLGLEDQP